MTAPDDIDDILLSAFAAGAGAQALTWLTNTVMLRARAPGTADFLLREDAGQRALVAEIHERIRRARSRREQQQRSE